MLIDNSRMLLIIGGGLLLKTQPTVFFLQAEDVIRDVAVTGVQTCALPISALPKMDWPSGFRRFRAAERGRARRRAGQTRQGPHRARSKGLWPHPRRPGACRCASSCRSEEHTSELQSRLHLVCRLLLEKKKI